MNSEAQRVPDPTEPSAHVLGDELRAVIRSNVFRRTMHDEEVGEAVQDIVRSEPFRDNDCQAPACELIEHDKHAERPPVLGAILGKVIGPHV